MLENHVVELQKQINKKKSNDVLSKFIKILYGTTLLADLAA